MAVESRSSSDPVTPPAEGVVCPFCAHVRGADASGACPKCTMEDTAGTRRSTGERIGPWFVLQRKNPTAPGLRFSVLLTLARRGHVTPRSIIRGPTTGQLWRYAAEVKGLSRQFGVCWHCRAGVSPDATSCPRCKSAQEIPDDPDQFLESLETLPVMRELAGPAAAEARGAPDDRPLLEGREETHWSDHALATTRRAEPTARPDRKSKADHKPDRKADRNPDRGPERKGLPLDEERALARARRDRTENFDNVDDLTRALTLNAPANGEPARADGARGNARATVPSILSASELAAAFQLGVAPPSRMARARRGAWKLVKVAAVIVLGLGVAGAVTAYVKPEWAARARVEAETRGGPLLAQARVAWTDVRARVGDATARFGAGSTTRPSSTEVVATNDAATRPTTGDAAKRGGVVGGVTDGVTMRGPSAVDAPKPPTTPIRLDDGGTTRPARDARPAPTAAVPSVVTPVPPPATRPTRDDAPATRPAAPRSTANTAAESGPADAATNTTPRPPAPRPPVETPPAAVRQTERAADRPAENPPETPGEKPAEKPAEVVSGGPKPMTLDEAIAQATELRNSALDAEARRDWRAAVLIYEQIGTLPEAARPSDLKVRLAVAKERLAAS